MDAAATANPNTSTCTAAPTAAAAAGTTAPATAPTAAGPPATPSSSAAPVTATATPATAPSLCGPTVPSQKGNPTGCGVLQKIKTEAINTLIKQVAWARDLATIFHTVWQQNFHLQQQQQLQRQMAPQSEHWSSLESEHSQQQLSPDGTQNAAGSQLLTMLHANKPLPCPEACRFFSIGLKLKAVFTLSKIVTICDHKFSASSVGLGKKEKRTLLNSFRKHGS